MCFTGVDLALFQSYGNGFLAPLSIRPADMSARLKD
jgi:hypothetical protein